MPVLRNPLFSWVGILVIPLCMITAYNEAVAGPVVSKNPSRQTAPTNSIQIINNLSPAFGEQKNGSFYELYDFLDNGGISRHDVVPYQTNATYSNQSQVVPNYHYYYDVNEDTGLPYSASYYNNYVGTNNHYSNWHHNGWNGQHNWHHWNHNRHIHGHHERHHGGHHGAHRQHNHHSGHHGSHHGGGHRK